MSKVTVEISDSNWFSGQDENVKPSHKQFCVMIRKLDPSPTIGLYLDDIKVNECVVRENIFFDVTCAMEWKGMLRNDNPSFLSLDEVKYWMPITFPDDVKEKILRICTQFVDDEKYISDYISNDIKILK